jgi:hypothetical protein
MTFMNFLVHSYTCCSDRHASPYWTFIRRWISMGFTPSLLKKRMTDAVLLWCMLQAGPPSLHYYCAVVLHSCIVLPPVVHSSNHEYHCCQLTRQSSCVSNIIALLRFSFDSPSYFLAEAWNHACAPLKFVPTFYISMKDDPSHCGVNWGWGFWKILGNKVHKLELNELYL